jgi:hypothetical protein
VIHKQVIQQVLSKSLYQKQCITVNLVISTLKRIGDTEFISEQRTNADIPVKIVANDLVTAKISRGIVKLTGIPHSEQSLNARHATKHTADTTTF